MIKKLIKKIIPSFVFSWYHFLLAFLSVLVYGFPSEKLIVIGVTGTNGKSTVVYLVTEILEEAGFKVASLSSIKFKIGNKEWPNMLKMTMPGRFKLQGFLKKAVKARCKYMILEVTSEGIKQHRHRFIDFNGVVFTNLTREHLEAHKGFENYKKAKGKLFKALANSKKKNKFAVFNADDKNSEYYVELVGNAKKYFYNKDLTVETSLLGEFNKYNALAAVNTGLASGIRKEKILKTIKNIKEIPGRMELVIKKPFKVFVDYAHTPDALEKVYKTLGTGLICVLGSCGGGRDKWKRPELGEIANKYCSRIILTNEDPYNENPEQILSEIKSGIANTSTEKVLDRREAINKALSSAKNGDVVIITGKGCESWICVESGKKIKWDDREVVREEFNKIYG